MRKQDFHPKYYGAGDWQGRKGENGCNNSWEHFKAQAGKAWKLWGRDHFAKHHRGTFPGGVDKKKSGE